MKNVLRIQKESVNRTAEDRAPNPRESQTITLSLPRQGFPIRSIQEIEANPEIEEGWVERR